MWQQAEDLPEESPENLEAIRGISEKPASTDTDSGAKKIQDGIQPAFKRYLGGIEAMHELYSSHGSDVTSIINSVQSVYEISGDAVSWAMKHLMRRHPLLRSSISYERQSSGPDKVQAFFVENHSMEPDFEALDRSDWLNFVLEEPNRTFENPKLPLWRVRLLKATNDSDVYFCPSSDDSTSTDCYLDNIHSHNTVFIITHNHTIMDGGYFIRIWQELMNYIDAYTMRIPIGETKKLPMLMPIEYYIRQPPTIQTEACDYDLDDPLCQARLCFNADTSFLDAYNTRFSDEISKLSKQPPLNGSMYLKLSQKATSSLLSACKREHVKMTGALTTACVLAMVDLIFPATDQLSEFDIPLEHEVDLRRMYSIDGVDETTVPFFTGVASIHLGVSMRLSSIDRPVDRASFWRIAGSFGKFSNDILGKPNATVFNAVKNSKDHFDISTLRKMTKKSPYVLCISNIGNLDHALKNSSEERLKVTSSVPHVSVLTEDMPIFYIGTQALNGQLTALISYCKSYTSTRTAQCYMETLSKYIHKYSK